MYHFVALICSDSGFGSAETVPKYNGKSLKAVKHLNQHLIFYFTQIKCVVLKKCEEIVNSNMFQYE